MLVEGEGISLEVMDHLHTGLSNSKSLAHPCPTEQLAELFLSSQSVGVAFASSHVLRNGSIDLRRGSPRNGKLEAK